MALTFDCIKFPTIPVGIKKSPFCIYNASQISFVISPKNEIIIMSSKLDMSLDEIIKTTKKPGRGGARGGDRGGRGGRRGNRSSFSPRAGGGTMKRTTRANSKPNANTNTQRNMNAKWKHDMFDGFGSKNAGAAAAASSGKLLVSNLDFGVSNTDIKELFADFGSLKKASVHFDKSGRSLGTADVIFDRKTDAIKAMKQYDGVPLDGRPMNIQMATSLTTSVADGRTSIQKRTGVRNGGNAGDRNSRGGFRRGGRGGGRGGRRGDRQPAPTAEELDADLDAFVNKMDMD